MNPSSGSPTPQLSIITISYKDPSGLRSTLKSISSLSLGAGLWEWVIVDSSPELNEVVVNEAQTILPKDKVVIRRIEKEPRGIYSAMNDGIAAASGRVLWFLNGGDTCADALAVSRLTKELDANTSAEWLVAGVNREKDGVVQYSWTVQGSVREALLGYNRVCHQGVLYKTTAFQKVGNYRTDLKQASDYDHLLRMVVAGLPELRSQTVIANFDVSGLGAQRYRDGFREMAAVFRQIKSQMSFSEYVRGVSKFYLFYFLVIVLKELGHLKVFQPFKPIWLRLKKMI